ncbi:hypothetical protein [Sinorhizobium meliloti]|nr:hypothetical protein [Sinorhizobium meliloti]
MSDRNSTKSFIKIPATKAAIVVTAHMIAVTRDVLLDVEVVPDGEEAD